MPIAVMASDVCDGSVSFSVSRIGIRLLKAIGPAERASTSVRALARNAVRLPST